MPATPRQIFTAPSLTGLATLDGSLIYLNGPIQGTANWQADAIALLAAIAPELHIASPRAKAFAGGIEAQLQWEQAAQERAAQNGVLVFWLAKETSHRCNRAFAAQQRFELGEWAAKSSAGLARIVVGIERGFTGGPYLQRRLALTYPNVPVCRTLQQACAVAAELAREETPVVVYPRTLAEWFQPLKLFDKPND